MNPQEPKTDYIIVMTIHNTSKNTRRPMTDAEGEVIRFATRAEAQTCANIEETQLCDQFIHFEVFERDLTVLRKCPKCEHLTHPVTNGVLTLCELCGWKLTKKARQ